MKKVQRLVGLLAGGIFAVGPRCPGRVRRLHLGSVLRDGAEPPNRLGQDSFALCSMGVHLEVSRPRARKGLHI
jgi:hypothetical protein